MRSWNVRNPWRGLQGLPVEIWVLAAVTLVNRAGTMVLPFLALYITRFVQGAWTAPADVNPRLNADFAPYTPLVSPDGKTFYFTSQRGLFEHPPIAPMSYAQFLDAIRAPGNGLADIYSVPIGAIPYKPGP